MITSGPSLWASEALCKVGGRQAAEKASASNASYSLAQGLRVHFLGQTVILCPQKRIMTVANPGGAGSLLDSEDGKWHSVSHDQPCPQQTLFLVSDSTSLLGKQWEVSHLQLLPVWVSDLILCALFLLGIPRVLCSCLFKERSPIT